MINQQYDDVSRQSKLLAERMRSILYSNSEGTGVSTLLQGQGSGTHYADSLQRFQKDYATYDREKRQQQKARRQAELEKKRIEYLERENRRWEMAEQQFVKKAQRERIKIQQQNLGIRRTANTNSLAYNPINLSYDRNAEGDKLKTRDEDHKIRGFVRAHNMDFRGNSKFNPLNGGGRVGIQSVIPNELTNRYQQKLKQHYESLKVQVPSTASSNTQRPRNYY